MYLGFCVVGSGAFYWKLSLFKIDLVEIGRKVGGVYELNVG